MPVLYIIRGLPGSGKTTYAKTLNCFCVEADMFRVRNGKYCFNPKENAMAHSWCMSIASKAMDDAICDVAVSNTFIKRWEFEKYLWLAKNKGYSVKVVRCNNQFENTHGVPHEVIERMKSNFEDFAGETHLFC